MPYALLADLVTAVHLAVVGFVTLLVFAVPIGGLLGWGWVRRPALRGVHLALIAYLCVNALRGELCILTHWEHDLRAAAGQEVRADLSFVGRLLNDLVYVDVDPSLLNGAYFVAGAAVVLGAVFVPPRRSRRSRSRRADAPAQRAPTPTPSARRPPAP